LGVVHRTSHCAASAVAPGHAGSMNTDPRSAPLSSSCHISGPGELLQAVPYLLGFHPQDSLVLIGLDDDRLVVTARLDLVDACAPGVVAHTLDAMVRGGSTAVLAAIYDDAPAMVGAAAVASHADLVGEVTRAGCDLLEILLVSDGRWLSLMCSEPDCCPDEGHALPTEPSAFAAAATYDGVVALPDRAALEAVLDPLPTADRNALSPLIAEAENAAVAAALGHSARRLERSTKRAIFTAARESDLPGWRGLDAETVARFGAGLSGIALRDAVWTAVDDERLDGRPLWRELARRLPAPYSAAPLFLFGWAAWRSGDGTLAGIAAERAVASDPGYSAADLLLAALSHGIDPRRLPRLRLPRSA
jgi:uncharacterized protein DUF4192